MSAEYERRDILHTDLEFIGEKMAEARAIEHARHAADHVMWQARKFAQCPNHRIERVGDADDKCAGRVGSDTFADGLHDFQIDAQKIITAHAWFACDACCHDDNVSASNIGVIVAAFQIDVKAFDGGALRKVERLALRHAFNNVKQDDIAQFL